jgi:ABC-type glutathione transport system ATPase component
MLAFTQMIEAEPHGSVAAALEIKGLRVEFPTVAGEPKIALRDIDLSIRPGEILGLVGESGAGKTTLARSILKLPPSPGRIAAGTVCSRGVDLLQLSERELQRIRGRDISMVVPNPRGELNPLLTVGDPDRQRRPGPSRQGQESRPCDGVRHAARRADPRSRAAHECLSA